MNRFESLLRLSDHEKEQRGLSFTPAEIAQQPEAWLETAELMRSRAGEIKDFLCRTGLHGRKRSVFILSGAGTSEFVGNAILHALRAKLKREGYSLATTHLVTHASQILLSRQSYVTIHFSRSGNSPESLETYRLARQRNPPIPQLVITCNRYGRLARMARRDAESLCLVLPERTNDRSLVMTSSFTSMALAALALPLLDHPEQIPLLATQLGKAAQRILELYADDIAQFAERPFRRACFLGSGTLQGAMQEAHLKLTEMTDGQIACRFDSYLGLRHGPKVFINKECIVVAALSPDSHVRRYELDLLAQLRDAGQGTAFLAVCGQRTSEISRSADCVIELFPAGDSVAEEYRILTDVLVGQVLGLFKCLELGLKPDSPSASGVIHRVVQGVTIYRRKSG